MYIYLYTGVLRRLQSPASLQLYGDDDHDDVDDDDIHDEVDGDDHDDVHMMMMMMMMVMMMMMMIRATNARTPCSTYHMEQTSIAALLDASLHFGGCE